MSWDSVLAHPTITGEVLKFLGPRELAALEQTCHLCLESLRTSTFVAWEYFLRRRWHDWEDGLVEQLPRGNYGLCKERYARRHVTDGAARALCRLLSYLPARREEMLEQCVLLGPDACSELQRVCDEGDVLHGGSDWMDGESALCMLTELSRAQIRRELRRAFSRPGDVALERGLFLLAAYMEPRVREGALLRDWEEAAQSLRIVLARRGLLAKDVHDRPIRGSEVESGNLEQALRVAVEWFGSELGMRGNTQDYEAESNQLVHLVMQHRKGNPITLSCLFVGLCRRAGIPRVYGVNAPFHFVAALFDAEEKRPVLIADTFRGEVLSVGEFCGFLSQLGGAGFVRARLGHDPGIGDLQKASAQDVLLRALNNLERSYMNSGNSRFVPVMELAVLMSDLGPRPNSTPSLYLLRWHMHAGNYERAFRRLIKPGTLPIASPATVFQKYLPAWITNAMRTLQILHTLHLPDALEGLPNPAKATVAHILSVYSHYTRTIFPSESVVSSSTPSKYFEGVASSSSSSPPSKYFEGVSSSSSSSSPPTRSSLLLSHLLSLQTTVPSSKSSSPSPKRARPDPWSESLWDEEEEGEEEDEEDDEATKKPTTAKKSTTTKKPSSSKKQLLQLIFGDSAPPNFFTDDPSDLQLSLPVVDPPSSKALYRVGMTMRHRSYNYRGVIFAHSDSCRLSSEWQAANNVTPDTAASPFYSTLVDTRDRPTAQSTYVAEANVEPHDLEEEPIPPIILTAHRWTFPSLRTLQPDPHSLLHTEPWLWGSQGPPSPIPGATKGRSIHLRNEFFRKPHPTKPGYFLPSPKIRSQFPHE